MDLLSSGEICKVIIHGFGLPEGMDDHGNKFPTLFSFIERRKAGLAWVKQYAEILRLPPLTSGQPSVIIQLF